MNNTSFILGRLGKNPTVKENNGFCSSLFSVATNEYYKKDDGEYETITDWVNIKALGKVAEKIKDWNQGDLVSIEGKVKAETWEDKNTGEKKYQQFLIAKKVKRVSKYDPSNKEEVMNMTVEDIPF